MERDRGAVVRPAHARRPARRPDARAARQALAVIAVVPACLLGLLARRGSWLSDDIEFLLHGSRGLWPDELLAPLNDHIVPGLRFMYAVFAETAPLNHDVTIAWRVLMQALAVWLMGLLLLRLVDRRGLALAGTFLYAATPVTMPSFMSLSSGVNNLPSHVFGLLVLHSTLDWFDGRRWRALAYGPLALLASLVFWEKSALIVVTVLGLTLWRHRDLPLRRRLRTAWPFAVALAIPLVGFGTVYLALRRGGTGDLPSLANLAGLFGDAATSVVLPALVGGPWRFTAFGGQPFGLADPPTAAPVLGGVVLLLLLLICLRFDRRVLFLWGAAASYYLATVVVVGYGRFSTFGSALTVHHHYWSDFAIPLVLAVVLTLAALPSRVLTGRRMLALGGCCLLAWSAGAVVSAVSFAGPWGRNPAASYFAALRSDLESAGPTASIWDTSPPPGILSGLAADRRLSSILAMAGIPVTIQGPDSEPRVVADDGHVRPGALASWAEAEIPKTANTLCPDVVISAAGSVTLPLDRPPGSGQWFVRVDYLASPDHALRVELLDRETGRAVEVPSLTQRWPAGLSTMYLGPAQVDPDAVRLSSLDPAENVCVSKVEVGLPVVTR